jgi:hypothetical protein
VQFFTRTSCKNVDHVTILTSLTVSRVKVAVHQLHGRSCCCVPRCPYGLLTSRSSVGAARAFVFMNALGNFSCVAKYVLSGAATTDYHGYD